MALPQAEAKRIREAHERVCFRGTPEKGYLDAGFWEFLAHCYTKDSHDVINPVKGLMADDKVYLKVLALFLLCCPVLAVPKSRQIRISWFMVAYALWHARTKSYRHVIWQSKKEDDANEMVSKGAKIPAEGRMDFMEQHLPNWLRDPFISSGQGNLVGRLVYAPMAPDNRTKVPVPWPGSKIEAVPQGADQVRGKTPSLYVDDEAAFQEEFGSSVVALRPAVTGGGQFVAVSSVDAGSHFNEMVLEGIKEEPEPYIPEAVEIGLKNMGLSGLPPGMRSWETPSGVQVLEIHYTADPDKDPATEQGRAWVDEAVKGYIGGFDSQGWRTEMEIEYNAGGGDPVYPWLIDPTHPVFIPALKPSELEDKKIYAGYDYGTNNPSCLSVWAFDKEGRAWCIWELYEPCKNLADHCWKMKTSPYWKRIEYIVCDPSITYKTQQTAKGLQSLQEQFAEHGVHMIPGRKGAAEPAARRFLGHYWADPDKPKAFLTSAVPHHRREWRDLRWEQHLTEGVRKRKNKPEKIRDKNNHSVDAASYLHEYRPAFQVVAPTKNSRMTIAAIAKELEQQERLERSNKGYVRL